jgi:PAS domain S-box-containing protein
MGARSKQPTTSGTDAAARDASRSGPARGFGAALESFAAALPLGVACWTLDGAIVEANDRFLRMIGGTRDHPRAGGLRWAVITPEEFRERDAAALAELRRTGRHEPYEKVLLHRDGSRVPIRVSSVLARPTHASHDPIDIEDPRCEAIAFVEDLTGQLRIERALENARAELERALRERTALIDNMTESILIADPRGGVVHRAASLADPADRDRSFAGVTIDRLFEEWELLTLDGQPMPKTDWPLVRALRGERFTNQEMRVRRRAGGTDFLASCSGTAIRDDEGTVVSALVTTRDITERVRDREALQRSEAEARHQLAEIEALYHFAPIGLCVLDRELRWRRVNKWIAELNGCPIQDHLGKTPREVIPDLADQAESALRQILETGEPLLDFEISGTTTARPGVVRTWNERWVPLKDQAGQIIGVSVVAEETTDRKRAEREREAMLRENERLYRQAEEANRTKDLFIATLSHELRTPLNAVVGWVSLLKKGLLAPDKQARALEVIERNTRIQTQLLSDILDISRITHGKLRLERGDVEMAALLESAIDAIRPTALEKGVELDEQLAGAQATVVGDQARLQQIVWNLLVNALKFTPAGGRIQVRARPAGSWVEVTVADNGAGIAPEFLPFVFDPFRQGDEPLARAHLGLGLGLPIVKHLVELHGGTVTAASDGPGLGATFTVRLPVAASVATGADVSAASPASAEAS